jgi:hypothetical protein
MSAVISPSLALRTLVQLFQRPAKQERMIAPYAWTHPDDDERSRKAGAEAVARFIAG